jgi:hypothetical protein
VAAPVLELRVPEDTLNRIDEVRGDTTRSAWLQHLIDRELNGQPVDQPDATGLIAPAAPSLAAIGDGEPSPGAICATPSCWQKNTRKYGIRELPLCDVCKAALEGHEHKRQMPPGAARLARRGAT